MSKKFLFLALTLTLGATTLSAQTDSTGTPLRNNPDFQRYVEVYSMARAYGDVNVEKHALYSLIALNPGNLGLRDSLALVYLQQRSYASAILVTNQTLAIAPNDTFALEIRAISYENINRVPMALKDYESLYLKTENLGTLYKIALLQFTVQKYIQSMTNVESLLKKKIPEDYTVIFGTQSGGQQEVPMLAAAYNLQGALHEQNGDKEAARTAYENALVVKPDFELAKENLDGLETED